MLVVIGALALLSGAVFAWASPTLFDGDKFAARARQALDDSPASCRPLRGQLDAPLFQFTHWVTPASRGAARLTNAREFLLGRAARCAQERGLVPNLVAVDFYKTGDLFRVVEELNADG